MVNNMAFENVDVSSLKGALAQCKNSLNHSATDELIDNMINVSIWQSLAQASIRIALKKLGKEKYKSLEDKINSYDTIASYIAGYKLLQEENEKSEEQYLYLSDNLYYTETYTTTSTANDGTTSTETHTRTVKNTDVELEMFNIRKKIEENKKTMDKLENKVSNSI